VIVPRLFTPTGPRSTEGAGALRGVGVKIKSNIRDLPRIRQAVANFSGSANPIRLNKPRKSA
jgi:hypothetical protein